MASPPRRLSLSEFIYNYCYSKFETTTCTMASPPAAAGAVEPSSFALVENSDEEEASGDALPIGAGPVDASEAGSKLATCRKCGTDFLCPIYVETEELFCNTCWMEKQWDFFKKAPESGDQKRARPEGKEPMFN